MRVGLLLFLFPVFSGMAQTSISPLLQTFEQAVHKNSYRKVMKTMDADYVEEQCIGNLHGNTTQFIDEFLSSGQTIGPAETYSAISLLEIESIYLTAVQESEQLMFIEYQCVMTNGKKVNLRLEASWDVSSGRWGFKGPYG